MFAFFGRCKFASISLHTQKHVAELNRQASGKRDAIVNVNTSTSHVLCDVQ